MGHPNYEVTRGSIHARRQRRLGRWSRTSGLAKGIFMAFQRPMAIPGVKMADFLRHATTNVRRPDRKEGEELIPMREFRKELQRQDEQHLQMDVEFAEALRQRRFFGR